jgi:hypothetical protein
LNDLNGLGALGLVLPTPAYLFGLILFGVVGYAGYRHGKKNGLTKSRWIGLALMLYPYAVTETWMLYGVGFALCAALYRYRK